MTKREAFRRAQRMTLVTGIAGGFTAAMVLVAACSGPSHEQNAVTSATYLAQQEACADQAKTLAESHACRCAHPAADGHVPDFCHDGGP